MLRLTHRAVEGSEKQADGASITCMGTNGNAGCWLWPATNGSLTLWHESARSELVHSFARASAMRPEFSSDPTRCSLSDFLRAAAMSKGTFFLRYRHNPEYAALLDIRTDRMHRLWIRRDAVAVIRAERASKATHGNRGRCAVRTCAACGCEGHPGHTWCRGCDTPFPRPS